MDEQVQSDLAFSLWTWGFGDDSMRNWLMAGLLMSDGEFPAFRQWVRDLSSSHANSSEMSKEAYEFHNLMADWIYRVSLRLNAPSCDDMINWNVSNYMYFWMLKLDKTEVAAQNPQLQDETGEKPIHRKKK